MWTPSAVFAYLVPGITGPVSTCFESAARGRGAGYCFRPGVVDLAASRSSHRALARHQLKHDYIFNFPRTASGARPFVLRSGIHVSVAAVEQGLLAITKSAVSRSRKVQSSLRS